MENIENYESETFFFPVPFSTPLPWHKHALPTPKPYKIPLYSQGFSNSRGGRGVGIRRENVLSGANSL